MSAAYPRTWPSGHNRAPILPSGSIVNMGTRRVRPALRTAGAWCGQARRGADRAAGGGGAVVVLRAGESPVHGEGRQRIDAAEGLECPKTHR